VVSSGLAVPARSLYYLDVRVQFVQFLAGPVVATVRAAPRAKRKMPRTAKAARIVRLVEALTTGLVVRDRVSLGRRMTQSLVRAYQTERRPVPGWVNDLHAYFDHGRRL